MFDFKCTGNLSYSLKYDEIPPTPAPKPDPKPEPAPEPVPTPAPTPVIPPSGGGDNIPLPP